MMNRTLYTLERYLRKRREIPAYYDANHILLASYPKSGNTWMRFILANLLRLEGGHPQEVDFHTVAQYMPEVRHNRSLVGAVSSPAFPTFLKTHAAYLPEFSAYRSVLVVRHPADVMVSYHVYLQEEHGKRLPELSRFIRHWRYGAPAWRNYHRSWQGHYLHLMKYEDLLAQPQATLETMAQRLGLRLSPETIAEALALSSKENMRRLRSERGDPSGGNPAFQFVRKGMTGEGKERLSASDLAYLERECGAVLAQLGLDYDFGRSAA